jgi:hypothetical protein
MTATPLFRGCRFGGCALLLAVSLAGCDFSKLAADGTANLLEKAAPALDGFWDYDLAGVGTPGAIMQLEAMLAVSPNNEKLALNLAKAYVGYAVGWVENDYEIAYAASEMEKSDRLRQRARLMYMRAHNLAVHCLRNREKGIDAAMKGGDATLRKYLKEHYADAEDVAPVFWAGLTLGAAINMSLDQPDLLAEIPTAKAFALHAKDMDDSFFNSGVYMFLGAIEAAFPAALGGDPEKGRALFEQGIQKTGRKNHMMLLNYARVYAVNTQNRELFVKLLTEIIEAPDLGPSVRLTNKVARRRAERYLAQANELF